MKTITKALVGTIAAGAMAMGSAVPAQAQWRDRDRGDGIDAGDIIAGALIIGGIAAVASAAGRGRYNDGYVYEGGRYGDRYGYGYGGGNPRQASSASTPPSVTPAAIRTAAARKSPTSATSIAGATATR